jgi:hypothetical protein
MFVMFGHYATLVRRRKSLRSVLLFYARSVLLFYATVSAPILAGLLPGGKQVRRYQCVKLKKRHPGWFRQDVALLVDLLLKWRGGCFRKGSADRGGAMPPRGIPFVPLCPCSLQNEHYTAPSTGGHGLPDAAQGIRISSCVPPKTATRGSCAPLFATWST